MKISRLENYVLTISRKYTVLIEIGDNKQPRSLPINSNQEVLQNHVRARACVCVFFVENKIQKSRNRLNSKTRNYKCQNLWKRGRVQKRAVSRARFWTKKKIKSFIKTKRTQNGYKQVTNEKRKNQNKKSLELEGLKSNNMTLLEKVVFFFCVCVELFYFILKLLVN